MFCYDLIHRCLNISFHLNSVVCCLRKAQKKIDLKMRTKSSSCRVSNEVCSIEYLDQLRSWFVLMIFQVEQEVFRVSFMTLFQVNTHIFKVRGIFISLFLQKKNEKENEKKPRVDHNSPGLFWCKLHLWKMKSWKI